FRADPQRFDAVLTDERMPGRSGSALIREVRGIRQAIPVVLMSGYLGMRSVDADAAGYRLTHRLRRSPQCRLDANEMFPISTWAERSYRLSASINALPAGPGGASLR